MHELLYPKTKDFDRWHHSLRDLRAKVAVARRIDCAAHGNLGDNKSVGEGVSELRIDVGVGYRVYYTMRREVVIILLAGGDKSSIGHKEGQIVGAGGIAWVFN